MGDTTLFDALQGLLPDQIDEVIFRARVPRTYLPSPTASPTARATAIQQWADQAPAANRQALRDVLERLVGPLKPSTDQPVEDLLSIPRSPIIIAVEESDDKLDEKYLLRAERHLTITFDRNHANELERLSNQLRHAESTEAIIASGKQAWSLLDQASQPKLSILLAAVDHSQRNDSRLSQPIAWTGKAELLIRIFRAVLASCRDPQAGMSGFVSVGYGTHYFDPVLLSDPPRRMAKRRSSVGATGIEIKTIAIANPDDPDAGLLPQIAQAVSAEVVVIEARDLNRPFLHLAEWVGRYDHSSTRLAIGIGNGDLTPEFLMTVLSTIPSASFAGPELLQAGLIEEVCTKTADQLERQTVPTVLSSLRNAALENAFAKNDVAAFKDALFWSTWSWVGRPLFATEFGEVIGACYPHLMDLRSIASRDWYFDRREDIPPKYQVAKLVNMPDDPDQKFHLYLTGAGGTGKSCFLRNVYDCLKINQSSVLPVWHKVDSPSSEWRTVEQRIKEETIKALEERYAGDVSHILPRSQDLRFFLFELVVNLRRTQSYVTSLAVFIDQLERTFESGDNPDLYRLTAISKEVITLLEKVGVDHGIRIFIASRKQYLPDFLSSFEKALEHSLHFYVLQEIDSASEQVGFVQTILRWCRDQHLVHPSLEFDKSACNLLASRVKGHPLNMMLALIRTLSQELRGEISEDDLKDLNPRPWEDLFYIDELLAAKDDLDWYFFLAMAHARSEIVRFTEVWWRLRLVSQALTERANSLGPQGVRERLWLLGHLGRTIYARPLLRARPPDSRSGAPLEDRIGFLEFFHANLRDHLVSVVMNYGGAERLRGRKGGMPPTWRALDRLTSAARDWRQSQQLMLREDISILMEQKDTFIEPISVDKKQVESFYLLFMRDSQQNRDDLFQSAKECFVYSAIVHDILGRWVLRQLLLIHPSRSSCANACFSAPTDTVA